MHVIRYAVVSLTHKISPFFNIIFIYSLSNKVLDNLDMLSTQAIDSPIIVNVVL